MVISIDMYSCKIAKILLQVLLQYFLRVECRGEHTRCSLKEFASNLILSKFYEYGIFFFGLMNKIEKLPVETVFVVGCFVSFMKV